VAPVAPLPPDPPAPAPAQPPAAAPQAYTIRSGDTLRGIATSHLPPGQRSEQDIQAYWKEIYRLNRAVLGPDPDLIHTGVQLTIPPPPAALPAAS
jgi:nucleoid-associated protein YgaU